MGRVCLMIAEKMERRGYVKALKRLCFSANGLRRLVLLMSAALILTAAVGFSLSFLVTQTPSLYNLFTSGLDPTGVLVIRKTVEHPFGGDYTVPADLAFTFAVDLGAENAGKTIDGRTADEYGVITVTVGANSAVTLRDIPAGTAATVTEQQTHLGFAPQDGKGEQTAAIEKGAVTTLEFVNTYTPSPARLDNLTVTGQKVLAGRDWQEGDSFTFQLALFENGGWTALGTETVTYRLTETEDPENPGQTILAPEPDFDRLDFTPLIQSVRFDKAGIYSFQITEIEGLSGGITYDKAESRFDVTVGDGDMDGYLEIQSVTTASANTQIEGFAVFACFENRYAPTGSTEAVIQIHKLLTDTSGQNKAPAGFAFALYAEDGSLVQTSEATTAAGETEIRLIFEPADAGKTFVYTLKEINGGQTVDGVSYDPTEIKLQISVVDNLDGTVSAYVYDYQTLPEQPTEPEEQTLPETGEIEETPLETVETEETLPESETVEALELEADEAPEAAETPEVSELAEMPEASAVIPAGAASSYQAEFQNIYDPQNAKVTITGGKELIGRAMKAGEFRFILYETGSDFQLGQNDQKVDSTANTGSEGDFRFAELSYSKVGTYYYVVTEDTSEPLGGVSYDKTQYFVTVRVTDNAGVLTPTVAITDETGQESELLFRNTYRPAKASVTLTGEKILSGRELEDGEFSFALYAADQDFTYTGAALQTVKNDGSGQFRFGELSYTETGTWYYVVKEQAANPIPGVVYDTTEYQLTVRVKDNGEGALIPTVERQAIRAGEQTPAESIRFENRYSANYATVSLGGEKILNGAPLAEGMFTFLLYPADAGYTAQPQAIRRAVNRADGRFVFDPLTFETAGTYYYVIVEDSAQQLQQITYDDAVYGVRIQVWDDGSGQLTAETTIQLDGKQADKAVFENTYTPEPGDAAATIAVKKTVNNTGEETIGPEGFAFRLDNEETGDSFTAISDTGGAAAFILTFTQEDAGKTYHYRLTEVDDGREDVTYSDAVYAFEITVVPDESGRLLASVSYDGETVDGLTAEFVNVYAGKGGTPSSPSDTPKTGDDSPVTVYAVLMAVSTAALIALMAVYIRWKRYGEK